MKNLIFLFLILITFHLKGQQIPSYIIGFELPGIKNENLDFSQLSDTVQTLENKGWKFLIQGVYNLNNFKQSNIEGTEVNRFLEMDSAVVILFFTNAKEFNFSVRISMIQNISKAEILESEIENFLIKNIQSYDGQLIINQLTTALKYLTLQDSNYFEEECRLGRNYTDSLITPSMITKEDLFFLSPSGVPIFIKNNSKVKFFTCNATAEQSGNIEEVSIYAKGMMMSFTYEGKEFTARPKKLNNEWVFDSYKYKNPEGEFEEYIPAKLFTSDDKICLGIFESYCSKFTLKIFKYENWIVSAATNKTSGPLKSVTEILENFTFEYKPIVDMGANYVINVGWQFVDTDDNVMDVPCPPMLDWAELNTVISGANYIEYFHSGQTIVINSKDGTRIAYHKYGEDDIYWMYLPSRDEWFIAELTSGAFIKELHQLLETAEVLTLKLAITAATMASGAPLVVISTELFAAGAMYAIDGDSDALAMDLILAPLGPVGDGVQMLKNANKVKDGLKNTNKFDDLTSATHKSYVESNKIKKSKLFIFINKHGKAEEFSGELIIEIKNKLGNNYPAFIDDLVDIASTNKQYIKLLEKVDDAYPYIKAWEKLITVTSIRKSIPALETVSKWLDDGIEVTFKANGADAATIIAKNGDEVGEFVKDGANEYLVISDDFFVSSGTPRSFGSVTVNANTGEVLSNVGYVKNADGTLGFIEDVSAYGNATIQNAIKQRGALRDALAGISKTQDAHHVIPVQLLKENDVVKKAVEGGFSFNTSHNGLAIEKFVKSTGAGRHGPHPAYTNQIRTYLQQWATLNPNFTAQMAKNELDDIVDLLKTKINTTSGKINDLNLGL